MTTTLKTANWMDGIDVNLSNQGHAGLNLRQAARQNALTAEIERLQYMVRTQADVIRDLEKCATEDGLTGLLNRRGWDEALDKAYGAYTRYGRDAAVMILDMNYFKQINDTYGHSVGDAALQAVAATLVEYTRISDVLARAGGDEFSVILDENESEAAHMKAAHLQNILNGITLDYGDELIKLNVSIGVATFGESDDLQATLDKADTRMYAVKAQVHAKDVKN